MLKSNYPEMVRSMAGLDYQRDEQSEMARLLDGNDGPVARLDASELLRVRTIPEVARLVGWSEDRMRRYLLSMHVKSGGRLLHNTSRGSARPRWSLTLHALRTVAPQWFG